MKKSAVTNIIGASIVAASLAMTLASCGESGTAPLGYVEISDEALTYHLYVPDDWTPDISTGFTSAYYSGLDPSNVSMMAFELDTSVTSIDSYWELYEPDLLAVFPDMEYVDTAETTLGDVAAKEYIYTATVSVTSYKFMQIVTITNNQVYVFTYTAAADKYDEHIEDVLSIVDYFEFK